MLLMIDNYDSFTYNIVQYLGKLGQQVEVYRNDKISLSEIERKQPNYLVISPGPCSPNEAGISVAAIQHFAEKLPILGVCLGHQSIAQAFGGRVIKSKKVMHGKISPVYHKDIAMFQQLPNPFNATRYHSLVVEAESLPECFDITAWTLSEQGDFDEIMGMKHKSLPLEGVQFHPESILTEFGYEMLDNFLKMNKSS